MTRHRIECPSVQKITGGVGTRGLSTNMTMMRAIEGTAGGQAFSSSANFPSALQSLPSASRAPSASSSRYGAIMTTIDRDRFINLEPSTEKSSRIQKVNSSSTVTPMAHSSREKLPNMELDQNNNQVFAAVPDTDEEYRIIEEVDFTVDGKVSVNYVKEKREAFDILPDPDEPVIVKIVIGLVDLTKDDTGTGVADGDGDQAQLPMVFDKIIDNSEKIETGASAVEYLDKLLDFTIEHEAAIGDFLAGKWIPGVEPGSVINFDVNQGQDHQHQ